MFESFLITFRETLEASLVVFIILSYLQRTGHLKYKSIVYIGIVTAVVASVIVAWLFVMFAGGFEGRAEELFEGTIMLLAALLLTTMIIWMSRAAHVRHQIEARVQVELADHHKYGLFAVVFIAVLREGIETVIFLGAITLRDEGTILLGALSGIAAAAIVGYLLFQGARKLHIKTFFKVTSAVLIFFAAGLVAHGIHEFQEAGLIQYLRETAWDTNHLLSENSTVGSIMKGLFGYNGNPSVLEVVAYLLYLGAAFVLYYPSLRSKTQPS